MYCSRIASLGFLLACVACNGDSVFPCLVSFVVMVKGDSNKSSDQQDVPNTDNRLSNMESQIMMLMSMVSDMKAQLSNQHPDPSPPPGSHQGPAAMKKVPTF